jgi:hypothetical protein
MAKSPTTTDTFDPRVLELIRTTHRVMARVKAEYAIGGALAMRTYGYSRGTDDVDLYIKEDAVRRVLREFAREGMLVEKVFEPHHYIALFEKHQSVKIRVDILVPADEPELSAVEHPATGQIAGLSFPVFPVELLVIAKGAYSERPEDHFDVAVMLHRGMFEPQTVVALLNHIDPYEARKLAKMLVEIDRVPAPKKRPTKRLPMGKKRGPK